MSRDIENQCLQDLINVYRSEPCLWMVKSSEYHDRKKKEAAYGRLIQVWKEVDSNCTKSTILKKINNLRSSYRKELKKVRESTKSGTFPDDLYVPKLWYYNLLNFLYDQENPRKLRSNFTDKETSENDEEDEYAPSTHVQVISSRHDDRTECIETCEDQPNSSEVSASPGTSSGHQNRQRQPARPSPIDKNDSLSNEVSMSVKDHFKAPRKPEDRFDLFGKLIALKVRDLPSEQRRWAEKFINDILFEAEGGNLDGSFAFVRQMPP